VLGVRHEKLVAKKIVDGLADSKSKEFITFYNKASGTSFKIESLRNTFANFTESETQDHNSMSNTDNSRLIELS
jgi:hypothetical protein